MDCCNCTVNLCINQGATFARVFTWMANCGCNPPISKPVDLTGYTASMQIRPYALSTIILYDASSNIVLGGILGTISLTIPAAITETFTWFHGVYDLLLTSAGGQVTRFVQGSVDISSAVTQ